MAPATVGCLTDEVRSERRVGFAGRPVFSAERRHLFVGMPPELAVEPRLELLGELVERLKDLRGGFVGKRRQRVEYDADGGGIVGQVHGLFWMDGHGVHRVAWRFGAALPAWAKTSK